MNEKIIFSMFVIGIVALLQVAAWTIGFNGAVFAFTSLIIGVVAGSVLGFSLKRGNGGVPPSSPAPISNKKHG